MPSALHLVPHAARRRHHAGQIAYSQPPPSPTVADQATSIGWKPVLYGVPAGLLGAYLLATPIWPGILLAIGTLTLGVYAFDKCPWTDAATGAPVSGSAWPATNPICQGYESVLPMSAILAGMTMIVAGMIRG